MATPPPPPGQRLLGRGRSAVVYQATDEHGDPVARKVFIGDRLGSLIHVVCTGATNPYTWNEDAIGAAMARRRVLNELVPYWFRGRLRIPETYSTRFDPELGAHEIRMEVVRGRPAPLYTRCTGNGHDLSRALARRIMRPLQRRLEEAGFDGLVWQAGKSNPVAASNFLMDGDESGASRRWVWLDLESGVPALFPINPATLLRFYIPRSIRHRAALFDDTDTQRLNRYLEAEEPGLRQSIGEVRFAALLEDAQVLENYQRRWRESSRLENSIRAALIRGRIGGDQAAFYRKHPVRWYARLGVRAVRRVSLAIRNGLRDAIALVHLNQIRSLFTGVYRFCTSGSYRMRLSQYLALRRVRTWRHRDQLKREEAVHLRRHIRSDEAVAYVTDFGIHLALKPPVKFVEYAVLPALATAGVISPLTLAVGMATGGMIARTAYTMSRTVQAYHRSEPRPWIALFVGLLPVVGNGAYPAQIVYTSAHDGDDKAVAQFLIYDIVTTIGTKTPVWGGRDTLTEHFFNRLPSIFLRGRGAVAVGVESTQSPATQANPASASPDNSPPSPEVVVVARANAGRPEYRQPGVG